MIYFALFTLGYFVGVFTFLIIFPPAVREIEEQEKDSLVPILDVKQKRQEQEAVIEEPSVGSRFTPAI